MPIHAYIDSLRKNIKELGSKKLINLEIMISVPNISDTVCHVSLNARNAHLDSVAAT